MLSKGIRRKRRATQIVAALVTAGTLVVGPAVAQSPPLIVLGEGVGQSSVASPEALIDRARASGSVRVIVGFEEPNAPAGLSEAEAASSRRAAIAARQEALLSGLDSVGEPARFRTIPYFMAELGADDLARLASMPGVVSIHEDTLDAPQLRQSVPLIGANRVWRRSGRGQGQAVVVLDTGAHLDHRAFDGRIVDGACFSSTHAPSSSTSLCPNGNDQQFGPAAAADCALRINGCGHGTHVMGIAGGDRNRLPGVARGADLIPMQVFSRFDNVNICNSEDPCALSFVSDQIRALERVLDLTDDFDIAAVNMSLGGSSYNAPCDSDPRKAIIDNLRAAGVATVISAGNSGLDGRVGAPGCISSAVTVGSSTDDDMVSFFSNHATMVDLMAPGSGITAPYPHRRRNNVVATLSGTSMAAPHVAGAFALLAQNQPGASVSEIQRALSCTGVPVERDALPLPRIHVNRALTYLNNPDTRSAWSFRNARQVDDWDDMFGNWFHSGRQMRVRGSARFSDVITFNSFCAESIDLRVRMRLNRNGPGAEDPLLGVIVNASVGSDDTFSGVGALFTWGDSGETAVLAPLRTRNQGVTSNTTICARSTTAVRPNGFNNLRVVVRGDQFEMYLNGEMVCDGRYTRSGAGRIGIYAGGLERGDRLDVGRVVARALRHADPAPTAIQAAGLQASSAANVADDAAAAVLERLAR